MLLHCAWYHSVEFGIQLSENEINATTKERFKDIVKESCKRTAFRYLLDEKAKVNDTSY